MSLPNLTQASFYATLEKDDVKFLGEHSEALVKNQSNVKDLELMVLITSKSTQSQEKCTEGLKNLLLFTKDLESVSLVYDYFEGEDHSLDFPCLFGLESSQSSLKSLKLEAMDCHVKRGDVNPLILLRNLETLHCDMGTLYSLEGCYRRAIEGFSSVLPNSLHTLSITYNCFSEAHRSEMLADMEEPEVTFARFLRLLIMDRGNVKKVITSRLPIDTDEKVHPQTRKWKEARSELKQTCRDGGIELVFK